jgi:hypothetical protein
VKTVAKQSVAGGATTTALEVTHVGAVPVPGSPTGTLVYDFASASTSVVSGIGGAAAEAAAESPSTDEGVAGPTGEVSAALAAGFSSPPAATAPGPAPAGLRTTRIRPATLTAQQVLARGDLRSIFRILYVIGAVAAALVLTGSALWRSRAVRVNWIPDR